MRRLITGFLAAITLLFGLSLPVGNSNVSTVSYVYAASVSVAQVKNLTVSSKKPTSVTLKWSEGKNAKGYEVYTYDAKKDTYKKVATVTKTSYTVTGLSEGKGYTFAVKAYTKSNGKTVYGKMSSKVKATTTVAKPAKVSGLSVSTKTITTVTLKWNKVSGAQKYVVYKYNSSSKKYVKVATTTDTKYKITGLKGATSYTFAVKAYKSVASKDYYSDMSKSITVKTNSSSSGSSVTPDKNLSDSTKGYITPTGKKFHLSASCAGKNAKATTYGKVKNSYGPCKKCAS